MMMVLSESHCLPIDLQRHVPLTGRPLGCGGAALALCSSNQAHHSPVRAQHNSTQGGFFNRERPGAGQSIQRAGGHGRQTW